MATATPHSGFLGESLKTSLLASADYSAAANQFLGVVENSSGQATVNSSAGGAILGVMQNKPKSGEAAQIVYHGECKVLLSGTVSAGNALKCAADGSFLLATTGSTVVGYMKEDGSSGDIRVAMISTLSRLISL